MHDFMRAVGFAGFSSRQEEEKILNQVLAKPQEKSTFEIDSENMFVEFRREFGKGFGVAVRGEYDAAMQFHQISYYPYCTGTTVIREEVLEVEKHAESYSYAGICEVCEDAYMQVIFFLQNVAEFLRNRHAKPNLKESKGVLFSALSCDGTILIPMNHEEKEKQKNKDSRDITHSLLAAARDGDEAAIESLTLNDIDIYTQVARRLLKEDILSIVDTCFMPYSIDTDRYYTIGEIMEVEELSNELTGETVYRMKLQCNEILMDLCINRQDLVGEPEVGRRFRGVVWMQGKIQMNTL